MKIEELYKLFLSSESVSIDSRNIEANCLFFALKGDNFDGNKYALDALKKGASYAIVDDKKFVNSTNCIIVSDVLETLQNLANYHRKQLKYPILALTGTNGKTTTKELIYCVLDKKFKVGATKGNFNNHIGVPLTILNLKTEMDIAIIEMGANHIGEIEQLCQIAEPDYGLITNIGTAHLEGFGSLEGVIQAKTELYKYIEKQGKVIFYNMANEILQLEASKLDVTRVAYSSRPERSILCGEVISSHPYLEVNIQNTNGAVFNLKTNLIGTYNLENIVAAFGIGQFFNLDVNQIVSGIEGYKPNNNRSQFMKTNKNELILDAYNANPSSMRLAINNFKDIKSELSKIVILGDMLELGSFSKSMHQEIVEELIKINFDKVFLVGEQFSNSNCDFELFNSVDDLKVRLEFLNLQHNLILIKGSRGIKLEKIVETL